MAKSKAKYKPISGIVMRFPHYPLEVFLRCLDDESEMLRIVGSNDFRNAILFASPALYEELNRWLSVEMSDKNWQKVQLSLFKYMARMASRCTPFASLASCGCVNWGDALHIRPDEHIVEQFRLDMLYCCMISQQIMQDKDIRLSLSYQLNNTIYAIGNRLRYISHISYGLGRTFQVREVPKSRPLAMMMKKAHGFMPFPTLARLLQDFFGLDQDSATDYIHALIDNQLLTSDIEPMVTGEDLFSRLISRVGPIDKDWNECLVGLQKCLSGFTTSCSVTDNESRYGEIKNILAAKGIQTNPKYLVQLDSFPQLNSGSFDKRIIKQLRQGLEFLCRLSSPCNNGNVEKFKQKFIARYQDQEIPLLEALDPDVGVGYIHTQDRISNPLIDGLRVPANAQAGASRGFSQFHQLLLNKLLNTDWSQTRCITLTDDDVAHLPIRDNDLPVTIAANFELLSKTDNGEYLMGNLRFTGCSAANLLGRFAYGDNGILDLVKQVAADEKTAHSDSIVAEIAHLPQNRTGNILSRPHIRDYEIVYMANTLIEDDHQIPANDLMLSVRHGKVQLRSARLGKVIVPRLTTAHNYSGTDTSPVYRFLCDLQHQQGRASLFFGWGELACAEHLPRVMYRNIIFAFERWNMRIQDLPFSKGHVTSHLINEWVQRHGLPRHVCLVAGDQKLLIDTASVLSVESMMSEIGKQGNIIIEEFIPCNGIARSADGGEYMNECIVPLTKNQS